MEIECLKVNEIVHSVSKTHAFDKDALRAINTSDIFAGDILQAPIIPTKNLKGQFKKTICKGDILFSEIRPANQRFARVNIDNTDDYVVSTKLMVLRKYNDAVDLDYFYYWLTAPAFLRVLQTRAENRICSFPQITFDLLSEYDVPVPNIKTQKEIADALSKIDKLISINDKAFDELEKVARDVFVFWFVQSDFPDENGHPYKSSGREMVWSEKLKRNIPAHWNVMPIGSLLEDRRGISYSTETIEGDGVPMINLASFTPDGQYNVDGLKVYSGEYSEDKILKPYDLVICNTQQTTIDFEKDIIGKALLVPDIFDGDIVSSHHVTTLKVYDDDMRYYLFRLFNTDYFHKFITGYTNGTNILGLLFDSMKQCEIEIPDKETLRKFARIIHTIESKKANIIKENQELAKLRDFLLPMFMSGQVHFL